ncbi:dTMP kinase [Athalassotoga saccharophila]|uniref:dTMP kinase n=1 Tax=Athalassotoga saccharophila TaxID=1441386 RepID=UPI0018D78F49|nr:dTMP kinase [Athalassotoga saccharophila]BBJ28100.1 thymidylate kinase [Athalassotoga saccharophila]
MPLITFEGIDGCGKSTQILMLKDYFEKKGIKCSVFREPGGTKIGEEIRRILLDNADSPMDPKTEFLLFAASRAQLVSQEIKPRIKAGEFVILDRYIDSSVAYQGFGRGLGKKIVTFINEFATDLVYPDLTFYIEIDEKVFEERKREKKDRIESEGIEFIKKVIEGYDQISTASRFVKVDGKMEQDQLFRVIIEKIKENFKV